MTHDEPLDPPAVVPSRELVVARPDRRPAPLTAAARLPARLRASGVVRMVTGGPLLGATAIAVVAAATGKAIQILTGAARPTNAGPPQPVRRSARPPAAGTAVRVTWTSVEIRLTSARRPGDPPS